MIRAALALAVALALATGCNQDEPTALPPGSPPSSTPGAVSSAPAATPSPTPTAAATTGTTRSPLLWLGPQATGPAGHVQLATKRYWSMVVRLAERPDPADPALAALALDPQRAVLVQIFTTNKGTGVTQRGPIRATVGVRSVRGATAEVTTCLDQTLVKVYERSGRARPGSQAGATPFVVQLRRAGGAWKVFQSSRSGGTCSIPR